MLMTRRCGACILGTSLQKRCPHVNDQDSNGLDYDRMVEDAMRGVVREALRHIAASGLPGNHHFYISFRTDAPGVSIPARLKAQYPHEITIVVQHQFWNLAIHDDAFEIELAFSGKRERLYVPFVALTGFVDPEVQFGLKFGARNEKPARAGAAAPGETAPASAAEAPATGGSEKPAAGGSEKIVSLDQFRKK